MGALSCVCVNLMLKLKTSETGQLWRVHSRSFQRHVVHNLSLPALCRLRFGIEYRCTSEAPLPGRGIGDFSDGLQNPNPEIRGTPQIRGSRQHAKSHPRRRAVGTASTVPRPFVGKGTFLLGNLMTRCFASAIAVRVQLRRVSQVVLLLCHLHLI